MGIHTPPGPRQYLVWSSILDSGPSPGGACGNDGVGLRAQTPGLWPF